MTDEITDITAGAGTIDNPASTEVTAEHYASKSDGAPSLVVTIDLGDILGSRWTFDTVLFSGAETGTDITLLFVPQGDEEAWDRLDEVGEW